MKLDQEKIRYVQERANNIWPAEVVYLLNGWILRINKGVTWRANSVLPLHYWGKNLLSDITKVEEIYRTFNSSSKFMLHDQHTPSELKNTLNDLSYKQIMPTNVMGELVEEIEIEELQNFCTYHQTDLRTSEWYSALICLSPKRSSYKMEIIGEIIDRVSIPRKMFFSAIHNSKIVGVALAIIDNLYIGIMNLAVDPDYRNKGIATDLVKQTIEWGKFNGAEKIFLQVEQSNTSAKALYDKIGFKEWYTYTYYEKDVISR